MRKSKSKACRKPTNNLTKINFFDATKIIFVGNNPWLSELLYFDIDGTQCPMFLHELADLFFSNLYVDECKAFIDKISNPVEFVNNEDICTTKMLKNGILDVVKFPTELKLRAAMDRLTE